MKLRNQFIPAMLIGVVAFSSCEKQETESLQPELAQGAVSHVLADSVEVTSYNFVEKQLRQINHYDQETGALESVERYERDGRGRPLEINIVAAPNNSLLSKQAFTYAPNGQLSKSEMTYYNAGNLEYAAYATYEYDAQERLKKKSLFVETGTDKASKLNSYTLYEVLPSGNYVREKLYVIEDNHTAKLFSTTTNSFDSRTNPFQEISEPGTASSPNNLVASTTVVHNAKKTYKYTYSYTYDERGLPLTQTITQPNSKQQTYKYLYSN